jgi:hypothetical protein
MRKAAAICLLLLMISFIFAGITYAVELTIVTGKESGTYYRFGLDLKTLGESHDFQLTVVPSNGSIENLNAVYKRPNTQLGIVQSDVLAFISRTKSNEMLRSVANKTKMVFPLYNEEVHLLARTDISDFDALRGKRVAIGEDGSGTYLTAKLLFEMSKIRPGDQVLIGTDDALAMLKAGKIDAMFYVAGYPVKLFSESVKTGDALHLVSITNQNILRYYPKAEIPGNTYDWQKEAVNTIAVKAVLVSFDFKSANCDNVGRFAEMVWNNQNWLAQNGHSKWKSVDLEYDLKGWEQFNCARKYIAKSKRKDPVRFNPVFEAIKEILE